jgi:hypothetical protein
LIFWFFSIKGKEQEEISNQFFLRSFWHRPKKNQKRLGKTNGSARFTGPRTLVQSSGALLQGEPVYLKQKCRSLLHVFRRTRLRRFFGGSEPIAGNGTTAEK